MQTAAIGEGEPWGLPLQFPTQANLFKQLGYSTWHVGKVREDMSQTIRTPFILYYEFLYSLLPEKILTKLTQIKPVYNVRSRHSHNKRFCHSKIRST